MSSWIQSSWRPRCVNDYHECHSSWLTKLSSSGSSLKKGLCSRSCWCTKFSMSTSKLADVMHSDPCVACSHFSNNNASRGNNGCLKRKTERGTVCVSLYRCCLLLDFDLNSCLYYWLVHQAWTGALKISLQGVWTFNRMWVCGHITSQLLLWLRMWEQNVRSRNKQLLLDSKGLTPKIFLGSSFINLHPVCISTSSNKEYITNVNIFITLK